MDRYRAAARALAALARSRPHDMSPSRNTCRLFALCSIIAIILTESPASGFTIPEANITQLVPPDLTAEESTLLEVKNDLKRPNDLTNSKDKYVKGEPSDTITITQEPSGLRTIEDQNLYTKLLDKNSRSIEILRKQNGLQNEFLLSTGPSNINNEQFGKSSEFIIIKTTVQDPQKSSTSQSNSLFETIAVQANKREKASTESIFSSLMPLPVTQNASERDNIENRPNEQGRNTDEYSSTYPLITELINTTVFPEAITNKNIDQYTTTLKETALKTDKISSAPEKKSATFTLLDIAGSSTVIDSIIELNDILYSTGASTSIDTTPLFSSKETETQNAKIFSPTLIPSGIRTNAYSSVNTVETEIGNNKEIRRTPGTEDYHITSIPITTTGGDMLKTDSLQTRIALEKVFTATPIASLEQLRQDLISATSEKLSSPAGTDTVITLQSTGNTENIETSTFTSITPTEPDKRDIVSSKRAGFLDLTVRTVPFENITTVATKNVTSVAVTTETSNVKETDAYATLYEIDMGGPDSKNVTGSESLSQLAEDAIKEELLKEEQLIDHAENAKRYRDEGLDEIDGVRTIAAVQRNADQVPREPATEDTLSVKPINQDKLKNSTLYTVSPNYKPMKKIDVQSPKQFVRDPDDNSWRNESISSLGIVFKPKNSSKSFTQVLRNKTEIELSNLSDSNKNNVPDLRERLGKIAEVRKSKKKKIDKFGETVYTDYEESGESSTSLSTEPPSSKTTTNSPTLPFSPFSSTTTTDNPVHTTPTTTTEKIQTVIGPLTTQTPNKFYNIAEYYDSGDEYDEYAKISKIDLKKNPKTPKEKVIITTPADFPKTKYSPLPDRQPTIQYFPPRVHQKVNVNDYDDNFQRKVNFYASRENPKYGSLPIATVPTVPPPAKVEPAEREYTVRPLEVTPAYHPMDINKDLYYTGPPLPKEQRGYVALNDHGFNKGSYVIKHFPGFHNERAKESDDERHSEYRYTESPLRGVTVDNLKDAKVKSPDGDDYEYDNRLRKDILNRFVDNFNQNSERFKVDFPVVYNSSVVHRNEGSGTASSSAFMKRLYNTAAAQLNDMAQAEGCEGCAPGPVGLSPEGCEGCAPGPVDLSPEGCEGCAPGPVELSPEYELHYYVPEQEEREEVPPRPEHVSPHPRFRL